MLLKYHKARRGDEACAQRQQPGGREQARCQPREL